MTNAERATQRARELRRFWRMVAFGEQAANDHDDENVEEARDELRLIAKFTEWPELKVMISKRLDRGFGVARVA